MNKSGVMKQILSSMVWFVFSLDRDSPRKIEKIWRIKTDGFKELDLSQRQLCMP